MRLKSNIRSACERQASVHANLGAGLSFLSSANLSDGISRGFVVPLFISLSIASHLCAQTAFAQDDDSLPPQADEDVDASAEDDSDPQEPEIVEEDGPSEGARASVALPASVHVVLFVGETPVEGVELVFTNGAAEAVRTDGAGSGSLSEAQGGEFELLARIPRENVPDAPAGEGLFEVPLKTLKLVGGETVEVIATLNPNGSVDSVDVEAVAGNVEEARKAESKKKDEVSVLGTVIGFVKDSETGQAIQGARILVRGSEAEAVSDPEGRFTIELPVGAWAISVIHPDYTSNTQPEVNVTEEEPAEVAFELLPASTVLEDFVITAPHVEGSVAEVLNERRESAALSDAISAEDISKSGAGDAAGAAQRVVGVTIVDGKFVYVRGLGERYTNALLNGSPMPSPEPDKATVPLDLLPTQVIRSIDIAKTSTPDFPADFAGGSVRIETITVPAEPIFGVSLKAGYNTQSTFRERAAFPTSNTDLLGFDSGLRAFPDSAPTDYQVRRGEEKPGGERLLDDEIAGIGKDFNSVKVPTNKRNLPNFGGSVIWGRGWDLSKDVKLGTLASFTYSRNQSLRTETIREFNAAGIDEPIRTWVEGESVSATDTVRWGAFGSLAVEFLENHEISLIGLRSQIADDNTRLLDLFLANNDADYQTIRNSYTSRALEFSQLRGQHTFPVLYDGQLDWRLTLARARLDQPDMRDVVYFKNTTGDVWAFASGTSSGRHFFADMVENAKSAFGDYTQPIVQGDLEKKIKFGGGANSKKRLFKTRRFSFAARGEETICGAEFDLSCPEELFTQSNIEDGVLTFQEDTRITDAYQAQADVYAGYAMLDFKLLKPLRLIGGARMEQTDQVVSAYNQYNPEDREDIEEIEFKSTDWLPSVSLIYTAADWIEFRGAFSKTVARPQLREIAPFQFSDYFGGVLVNGNPELRLTQVTNYDLRVDVFPSPAEVISLSGFVKDFVDPIEPILQPSSTQSIQTFDNARGAFLYGMELEARKSLEFLHGSLEYFSVMGNLTLATSQIRLNQTGGDESGEILFITNTDRPMVNQAPYVVNLALDFEIPDQTQTRLLFNVSGPQIVQIGTQGLDDQYQQPRPSLDLTFSQRVAERWRIGGSVKNILNSRFLVTQGKERDDDKVTLGYRRGVSFGVKVGYSL